MKKKYEIWTYEKCLMEAKKFDGRYDFQKGNSSAYTYAYKNGILNDICSHMKIKNIRWTDEMLAEEAKKYNNKSSFQAGYSVAYTIAQRRGFPNGMCDHMEELKHEWTNEELFEEAKKYDNRSDFSIKSCGAYHTATRRGILDQVCAHMQRKGSKLFRGLYVFEYPMSKKAYVGLTYNYEERYNDHLNKTKSIVEMNKIEKHVFKPLGVFYDREQASIMEQNLMEEYKKNGWMLLNKIKGGGLGGNTLKWTKELLIEEALKYKTKWEFVKGNLGAYDAAHKRGLLKEICSHMPKYSKSVLVMQKCKKIICNQTKIVYESVNAAAEDLNTSPSCIFSVLNGTRKSIKGCTFEYISKP